MKHLPICITENGCETPSGEWIYSEYLNNPAFSYRESLHFKRYNYAGGEVQVDCYTNGVTTLTYMPTGVVTIYRRGQRDVAFGDARYKADMLKARVIY